MDSDDAIIHQAGALPGHEWQTQLDLGETFFLTNIATSLFPFVYIHSRSKRTFFFISFWPLSANENRGWFMHASVVG